jgi:hypothetical protein
VIAAAIGSAPARGRRVTAPLDVAAEPVLTAEALALYPEIPLEEAEDEVDEYETAIDDDEAEAEAVAGETGEPEADEEREASGG